MQPDWLVRNAATESLEETIIDRAILGPAIGCHPNALVILAILPARPEAGADERPQRGGVRLKRADDEERDHDHARDQHGASPD